MFLPMACVVHLLHHPAAQGLHLRRLPEAYDAYHLFGDTHLTTLSKQQHENHVEIRHDVLCEFTNDPKAEKLVKNG
jgi:hypothetical protein